MALFQRCGMSSLHPEIFTRLMRLPSVAWEELLEFIGACATSELHIEEMIRKFALRFSGDHAFCPPPAT